MPSREDSARGREADDRTFSDSALIAMRRAVRQVILDARQRGGSLVVWQDGRVAHVPAADLELPPDEDSPK